MKIKFSVTCAAAWAALWMANLPVAQAQTPVPGYSEQFLTQLRARSPLEQRVCVEGGVLERWPDEAAVRAAAAAEQANPDEAQVLAFAIREALTQCGPEPDWFDSATIRLSDIPADAPRFEDYKVKTGFKGKPAAPDVRSHPRSRLFRTMLRMNAKEGPDFAGHYTIASWGCGSGCSEYAIIDAITGRVFHPPQFQSIDVNNIDNAIFETDQRLVRYRRDSRLLMVIGGINEDPKLRGISYFVWDGARLKRIRFVARPEIGSP